MGGGYLFAVRFRITPDNGVQKTIVLDATTLQDGRGPVGVVPSYELEAETESDVVREMRQVSFGWRQRVALAFDIRVMTDQANLAELVNALVNPGKTVELSLDGGTTYREVLLEGGFGPQQFSGKWTAGAHYEMALVVKELLPEVPAIVTVDGAGKASVW